MKDTQRLPATDGLVATLKRMMVSRKYEPFEFERTVPRSTATEENRLAILRLEQEVIALQGQMRRPLYAAAGVMILVAAEHFGIVL